MNHPDNPEPRWQDLLDPALLAPLLVLCTGVLLHSMNALLMSTVMPSAVKDIGGLAYMSWPTTSFLAASVVAASSGGTVRALVGAKTAYIGAAFMFGMGSLLSGLAPDMGYLVLGRFIQGGGGGLLSSIAYVMVANVFPARLWPRVLTLLSSIWGISVLLGPLTGGVFAALGFWRGAFLVVFAIATLLAIYAARTLPADEPADSVPVFPGVRLGLVSLAILLLSMAAPETDAFRQVGLIILATITFVVTLRLDARSASPLLPSDAFSVRSTVGLGLWILFLITAANDPFPIYGPLFLQALHGMSPLSAGYLVAMESMAWTIVAALVASLPLRYSGVWLITGPVTMGVGLLGISLVITSGNMPLLLFFVFLAGGGIGACFSFLSQAILANAKPGEGDAAASSIATIQLIGLATGAALAGLIANLTGLRAGLSVETVTSASSWVPGIFAGFTTLASIAAIRLVNYRSRSAQLEAST